MSVSNVWNRFLFFCDQTDAWDCIIADGEIDFGIVPFDEYIIIIILIDY